MGGQTGGENAKTQTADRTDRADWRMISYLPKLTLQSGIPMIISIFLFVIFSKKAEDFGVITSFSRGNGREISSPQQSVKGTI